ncbi:MAG: zinc ribbon domain-containing protein, partial [Anaerolineae bacterium]|nr:zinc ribbon domain-containing protein [Anaerolineae bacterium]
MECPHCDAQNRPGAKFCQTCGAILTSQTPVNESDINSNQQQKLPVTAPLPSLTDTFSPLPVGALLDRGRYVIWEVRSSSSESNTYLVEDLISIRQ